MSLPPCPPFEPSRRPVCSRCARPQSTCICRWATAIDHEVEVVILQHPLEEHQAKGSARLAHLCLANSRLHVGEQFSDTELDAMLGGEAETGGRCNVLLYPETPGNAAAARSEPAPENMAGRPGTQLRLIVLDATWRKSRKMLYLNPRLAQLPRQALNEVAPSRYRIRQAHKPDQLSTLEAIALALTLLEGPAEKFQPLLQAFEGFIAQQISYRPPAGKS